MYKKSILPTTIFARFLVIIITPIIIAQIIAIYVFYHRHWSNNSEYMIENLSNEILLVTLLYQQHTLENNIIDQIKKNIKIYHYFENGNFIKHKIDDDLEIMNFYNSLANKINLPLNVISLADKNEIEIQIKIKQKILFIKVSRKQIDNPTIYIFILWMTGTTTILTIFSILFLRNQVKSIKKLADAAESFGKGMKMDGFKPSGALEVKNAGKAFIIMKDRIERQISQRTFMLSAVSHDLKTPITRIKLELEMIKQDPQILDIKEDIKEMEKMINHYLAFAKGEDSEISQYVDIMNYFESIINNYKNLNIIFKINCNHRVKIRIRKESFKRAINNLIENSIKYSSSKISINIKVDNKHLYIEICDDGIGIDDVYKELVFKPFYRIDDSRNSNSGNVGLGMAISKDIINSHGGEIKLMNNEPRGLKLLIDLPL